MKKRLFGIMSLTFAVIGLSGCSGVGEKTASLSIIYAAAAVLSLLLLITCCILVRKDNVWFVLLFSSVLIANIGYTLLAVSSSLEMALWANRVSYLGSVFLPLSMLMIILKVANTRYKRWLPVSLFVLSAIVFLVAASPGILDIYYKEVSFEIVEGVSALVKVYGPLHSLYMFYLVSYFVSMVAVIINASVKKRVDSSSHAVILAIAVLVNIGVWLIEQLSDIDFEMLSVSYIISEVFLLGLHLVMRENHRLRELVLQKEEALHATSTLEEAQAQNSVSDEAIEYFLRGLETLTPTERTIYYSYVAGASTKEIMRELNIKENTLKFHNKNLYSKLGVSSRKRLLEINKEIGTGSK